MQTDMLGVRVDFKKRFVKHKFTCSTGENSAAVKMTNHVHFVFNSFVFREISDAIKNFNSASFTKRIKLKLTDVLRANQNRPMFFCIKRKLEKLLFFQYGAHFLSSDNLNLKIRCSRLSTSIICKVGCTPYKLAMRILLINSPCLHSLFIPFFFNLQEFPN